MRGYFEIFSDSSVNSYEERLDHLMRDIVEENNQYSPRLIQFDKNYFFSFNRQAWKNNILIRAVSYDNNPSSTPFFPIDKNQLMINQEITYQRRIKLFMDQFNTLEKMERLMFIHKYFYSYLNKSVKEICTSLQISPKKLSLYKKRAIEKMITICCLDIWTTLEYGAYFQDSNTIEDEREERWKKLGLTYTRMFERVEFDWEKND